MAIIGLDVGSTGCKCIIFSDDGINEAYAYREYTRNLSCTTLPAQAIWDSVCSVLKETNETYVNKYSDNTLYDSSSVDAVHKNTYSSINDDSASSNGNQDNAVNVNADKYKVKAICISSFGESFVSIDNKGNALSDLMLYTDPRGKEECEEFFGTISEEDIMKITGIKPHAMFSLPKIAWLRKNKPEIFANTWKFLLIEDYIIYKLCGLTFIDYSLASRTMAFDITKKCWDKSLLSLAGIDESNMSTPVPSGTIVGNIHRELAVQLDLPLSLKIITGAHDQVCAAVGAGVAAVGTAIDGIGTVECITPVFSSPILESEFLNNNFACVPYAIPGMYATYAFNFTGGSLLKWFRDNFAAKEEIEALETGKSVYRILDEKCAKQPTSVMVIPHFAGSGTPDMNSSDTGSIVGLTFQHGSPEIYRSLLEGVTFEMKYNMELLKSVGVQITELRAVGGGAKSKLWLEIKAAITGCRILQLEVDEAGITGAAILASVALGNYSSISEAAKDFIKVKNVFEPDLELKAQYDEMYLKYKKIRNRSN